MTFAAVSVWVTANAGVIALGSVAVGSVGAYAAARTRVRRQSSQGKRKDLMLSLYRLCIFGLLAYCAFQLHMANEQINTLHTYATDAESRLTHLAEEVYEAKTNADEAKDAAEAAQSACESR